MNMTHSNREPLWRWGQAKLWTRGRMEHGAGLTKLPMAIEWGKPSVVTAVDARPDFSDERHGALKRVAYPAVCICIDCALVYLFLDKP